MGDKVLDGVLFRSNSQPSFYLISFDISTGGKSAVRIRIKIKVSFIPIPDNAFRAEKISYSIRLRGLMRIKKVKEKQTERER